MDDNFRAKQETLLAATIEKLYKDKQTKNKYYDSHHNFYPHLYNELEKIMTDSEHFTKDTLRNEVSKFRQGTYTMLDNSVIATLLLKYHQCNTYDEFIKKRGIMEEDKRKLWFKIADIDRPKNMDRKKIQTPVEIKDLRLMPFFIKLQAHIDVNIPNIKCTDQKKRQIAHKVLITKYTTFQKNLIAFVAEESNFLEDSDEFKVKVNALLTKSIKEYTCIINENPAEHFFLDQLNDSIHASSMKLGFNKIEELFSEKYFSTNKERFAVTLILLGFILDLTLHFVEKILDENHNNEWHNDWTRMIEKYFQPIEVGPKV